MKKERQIWHSHFNPSIIAALVVVLVTVFLKLTISNIILFSSVAASAFILTNVKSHQLTSLRTTIVAYLIALLLSSTVYLIALFIVMPVTLKVFVVIFLTGMGMYLADAVHPPAISASLSFVLLEGFYFSSLISLFFTILSLLIAVRVVTYVFSKHLTMQQFLRGEFKKKP